MHRNCEGGSNTSHPQPLIARTLMVLINHFEAALLGLREFKNSVFMVSLSSHARVREFPTFHLPHPRCPCDTSTCSAYVHSACIFLQTAVFFVFPFSILHYLGALGASLLSSSSPSTVSTVIPAHPAFHGSPEVALLSW